MASQQFHHETSMPLADNERAARHGNGIQKGGATTLEFRPGQNPLMDKNFARRGDVIVGAQTEPALRQQNRRKGAGNKQYVVEPVMKENDVTMRLDQPAIDRL
jgi:hypothetical protein